MKKASVVMGLALALSLSAFASGGAQQGQKGQRQDRGEQGEMRRGPGGRGGQGFLLRGITLTDNQKQQVKSLHEAQRKEFEGKRGVRGERGAQRDTIGLAARRAEMSKQRDQQTVALRTILTSQQRVQFDKNVAELKQRMAQRGQGGQRRPDGFRKGNR